MDHQGGDTSTQVGAIWRLVVDLKRRYRNIRRIRRIVTRAFLVDVILRQTVGQHTIPSELSNKRVVVRLGHKGRQVVVRDRLRKIVTVNQVLIDRTVTSLVTRQSQIRWIENV